MSDIYNKKEKYVYFVTGGGTGGHIYPAIAVCDELKADSQTQEIYYVGNPKNLEYEIARKLGYKFLGVNISGMPRKIGFGIVKWFFELQWAIIKCVYYIHKYKPDIVFGTGGYVSAPALFAGNMTNTPLMIHDSDAQPGIVSRYIAPMAKCVSLAFEGASKVVKSKNVKVNGNPIRTAFKTKTKPEARCSLGLENDVLTLCVMGGSQGAESINSAFVEILPELLKKYDLQVIFQTGKKNWAKASARLKEIYPDYENNKKLIVKPYFDDMVTVLKACDIAVSRAGSLSLSELCACAIAPILIPYPHAAADHQRKNAKFMESKRAALYLEDADTTKETLLIAIEQLLENSQKFEEIRKNSWALAKLDSTILIVNQLKSILKGEE